MDNQFYETLEDTKTMKQQRTAARDLGSDMANSAENYSKNMVRYLNCQSSNIKYYDVGVREFAKQ